MPTFARRLRIYQWTCQNDHRFDAPYLGDFAYGEFIARSPGGAIAFVDTFADPVWDEVAALVDEASPRNPRIDESDRAQMVQLAYGLTLDPDPTGPFRIDEVRCPVCGAEAQPSSPSEPARWLDHISPPTHDAWTRLHVEDKRRLVAESARRALG